MAIVVTRQGLPGGREGSVDIAATDAGSNRVRNCIAEALESCTKIQDVQLVSGKNVVKASVPDEDKELIIRVSERSDLIEVTKEDITKVYKVDEQQVAKVHRMLLTEFMLRDNLAGHLSSAFTCDVVDSNN